LRQQGLLKQNQKRKQNSQEINYEPNAVNVLKAHSDALQLNLLPAEPIGKYESQALASLNAAVKKLVSAPNKVEDHASQKYMCSSIINILQGNAVFDVKPMQSKSTYLQTSVTYAAWAKHFTTSGKTWSFKSFTKISCELSSTTPTISENQVFHFNINFELVMLKYFSILTVVLMLL
jgi:hypothetical protein